MKKALSLLTCLTLIPTATANLITNGSFEDPVVTDLATGFASYNEGESIPGWTVGGGSVDVVSDNLGSWVSWKAAAGHQSVDLNGSGPGWIFQDLATDPGQSYHLSFALAANTANCPWVVLMQFLWHGEVVDTLAFQATYNPVNPGWTYVDYTVTAPTDLARLTFGSLVSWGTAGAAIDDIVLEAIPQLRAVPDSSGWWLGSAILLPVVFRCLGAKGKSLRELS